MIASIRNFSKSKIGSFALIGFVLLIALSFAAGDVSTYKDLTDAMPSRIGRPNRFIHPSMSGTSSPPNSWSDEYRIRRGVMPS